MLAFLFLLLTIVFGISIATRFIDIKKIYCQISGKEFGKSLPLFLFNIPAGIIIGIMFTTFINYFIIYFLNTVNCKNISFPLGIIITSLILFVCSIINIKKIKSINIYNHIFRINSNRDI